MVCRSVFQHLRLRSVSRLPEYPPIQHPHHQFKQLYTHTHSHIHTSTRFTQTPKPTNFETLEFRKPFADESNNRHHTSSSKYCHQKFSLRSFYLFSQLDTIDSVHSCSCRLATLLSTLPSSSFQIWSSSCTVDIVFVISTVNITIIQGPGGFLSFFPRLSLSFSFHSSL